MKILMFGWEFPPQFAGGLGVATYGLTRALARGGDTVLLALPAVVPIAGSFVTPIFADLPPVVTDASLPATYASPEEYARAYGADGGSLLARVRAFGCAARAIALSTDFDIIHAHDWLTVPAALEAKRVSGKPLALHIHATEYDRSGGAGANEAVYAIERAGMEGADRVIAVSRYTKALVVNRYGIDPEKIIVVHNGIDSDHMESMGGIGSMESADTSSPHTETPAHNDLMGLMDEKARGAKFILFAGRITLQKGPDYFVELARRLLALRPDLFFVMIGTGDLREQITRQVAGAGLSHRFLLHGYYTHTELRALLDLADLYVFPSVSEPFGLVPLEAAQRGTPVLLSRQTGVAEVMQNALMVDFWDIDEMVNKTITLLDHPALAKTLQRNGREEIRGLDWHRAGVKVSMIYRTLINKSLGYIPYNK